MDLERFLSIVLSLCFLVLGAGLRFLTGVWVTPASLFCGFWFLFSFLPLVLLPSVPVNPLCIGYIVLACAAFALPALGLNWRIAAVRNAEYAPQREGYLDHPAIRWVFGVSCGASLLLIVIDLLVQGVGLRDLVLNFFETSNAYMVSRYEGAIKVNPFGQWGLIAAYLCVTFGGVVYAHAATPQRRTLALLGSMGPPVLIMLVQSAKGLFFVSIAIILCAVLVCRVLADRRPLIDFPALLRHSRYLLLAFPLVIVSFLSRGLYTVDDWEAVVEQLLGYLSTYALMHLYAFSDWFSFATGDPSLMIYSQEPAGYGFFSFKAAFTLLGSTRETPPGFYDEYFWHGTLRPGNIYTMFRGLIMDFGLGGSLVAICALGFLFNYAYYRIQVRRLPALSIALVFLGAQFVYSSYLVSVFIWSSIYLVTLLVMAILLIHREMFVRGRRPGAWRVPLPEDGPGRIPPQAREP